MNKNNSTKAKYCIQSEKHPQQITVALCSLMEHQCLVDIAICCGNNILHAHKIVLAANSPMFKEEFEKNSLIEQVIITGCDFSVMRSVIEFIYCGETVVEEDSLKYLVAAAKLFQMKTLENLSLDYQFPGEQIVLPKPQFLSKKPKYPAYPFNPSLPPMNGILKQHNYNITNMYKPHKLKRKCHIEPEHQACLKEAQASRLAIANLKKEIASAPQANSFIIEESCTETTVENFIPHTERQNFMDIDYENLQNQGFLTSQSLASGSDKSNNAIQMSLANNRQPLTTDKIKNILGNDSNADVELMFKTNDGSFVTLTDAVLQNFEKDGLQYQVIDEEGRMGELHELEIIGKENVEDLTKKGSITEDTLSNTEPSLINSNGFFGNSQILFRNEPLDMRMENSRDLEETSDQKELDMLQLNGIDIKPTHLVPSTGESENFVSVSNYFSLANQTEEGEFNSVENPETKENIVKTIVGSSFLMSSMEKNDGSFNKFSPDIFFANASTLDDIITVDHLNDPLNNKICS